MEREGQGDIATEGEEIYSERERERERQRKREREERRRESFQTHE